MRPLASPLVLSFSRKGRDAVAARPLSLLWGERRWSVLRINQSMQQIKPPLIESD